jgi:hypothetical protein
MLNFYAAPFVDAMEELEYAAKQMSDAVSVDKIGDQPVFVFSSFIIERLIKIDEELAKLPLADVTRRKTKRLIERIEAHSKTITIATVKVHLRELHNDILLDLSSALFLFVNAEHSRYYTNPLGEWTSVVVKFPSTVNDIEEASKCFALNRWTATVFHLMRVMEVGLRFLGTSLNDPSLDPKTNPTWERILRRCRDELSKPLQQRSTEWRLDEPFYAGATARLME